MIYRAPADPVMAHVVAVVGSQGVNLWHARQVAATQAAFERDPAMAITSNQVMQIARDTCPRSHAEVDAEVNDDCDRGVIDVRNNSIVGAVLDETADGGFLMLCRFSAIVLEAGESAASWLSLAFEKASAVADCSALISTTRKTN
jgi:hypothetical protein